MFSKNTWHHFFNLHCMTEQPVISLLLALLDWTLRTFELLKVIKGHLISSSVDFMKWHIIWCGTIQHYLLQSYYNACVSLCPLCPVRSGQLQWVPINQNQHCALGYKTHSAWQRYKTTKSGAKRRTQSAEPRNVMFFGCVFSVKVLTVIMLHWRYAEMREAFHLRPCNCESTNHCGISTFMTLD